MQVVILAGGKGSRLRPYTTVLPKPLMPLGEFPVIELIIRQLAHYGYRDILLSVGYLAELLRAYCGDGRRWGVHIDYSHEEKPLSTIAPLLLLRERLTETFLVMNGDVVSDLDFRAFEAYHRQRNGIATIATFQRKLTVDFGVIHSNPDGRIVNFLEKPQYDHFVSMGIYLFEPGILQYVPDSGEPFGFDNLMHLLTRNQARVYTYPHEGIWLDIGRLEDYERAVDEFGSGWERLLK
jgi:NDP-sugar pyrophosphorylase family protein